MICKGYGKPKHEVGIIVNKFFGLCPSCNGTRLKQRKVRIRKSGAKQKEKKAIDAFIKAKSGGIGGFRSDISDERIDSPTSYNVHHILPKGAYEAYRCEWWNFMAVTRREHDDIELGHWQKWDSKRKNRFLAKLRYAEKKHKERLQESTS